MTTVTVNVAGIESAFRQSQQARRARLAGAECTLNGRLAKIVGVLCQFPTVCTVENDPELNAEFSWSTVAIVMQSRAGQFRC